MKNINGWLKSAKKYMGKIHSQRLSTALEARELERLRHLLEKPDDVSWEFIDVFVAKVDAWADRDKGIVSHDEILAIAQKLEDKKSSTEWQTFWQKSTFCWNFAHITSHSIVFEPQPKKLFIFDIQHPHGFNLWLLSQLLFSQQSTAKLPQITKLLQGINSRPSLKKASEYLKALEQRIKLKESFQPSPQEQYVNDIPCQFKPLIDSLYVKLKNIDLSQVNQYDAYIIQTIVDRELPALISHYTSLSDTQRLNTTNHDGKSADALLMTNIQKLQEFIDDFPPYTKKMKAEEILRNMTIQGKYIESLKNNMK